MTESKPMKWAELRERVAKIIDWPSANVGRDLEALLADIDAAAEAMERQEHLAKSVRDLAIRSESVCVCEELRILENEVSDAD